MTLPDHPIQMDESGYKKNLARDRYWEQMMAIVEDLERGDRRAFLDLLEQEIGKQIDDIEGALGQYRGWQENIALQKTLEKFRELHDLMDSRRSEAVGWTGLNFKPKTSAIEGFPQGTECWWMECWCNGYRKVFASATPERVVAMGTAWFRQMLNLKE